MADPKRSLRRAKLLERVRAVEKRAHAAEAQAAEEAHARLEGVAARSLSLASDYAATGQVRDGLELRARQALASGLHDISMQAAGNAQAARRTADARLAELAGAEQRRRAAQDHAIGISRAIDAPKSEISPSRKSGTALE
ncbi:MAG: hypothetical protein R3E18_08160 [Sphingomonadaceae bacterium]|nr:hypothetical protein [Sphingomonadaceae bacterium]